MLTEPLLERLEEKEKDVEVIRIKKIDLSEHCDLYVLRSPPLVIWQTFCRSLTS